MRKVLIIGINGMLGHVLADIAMRDFEIVGTYTKFISNRPYQTESLDILDKWRMKLLVEKLSPDFIVNCSGITDLEFCEIHPEIARALHIDGTRNLAEASHTIGAKLVYISTDSVFDGKRGNYTEQSKPNPINIYSKTKLEGEKVVPVDGIIIRTSIYGWNISGKKGLVEWIIDELSNGRKIVAYTNYYFTPMYTGTLSSIIIQMLRRDMRGLYHVGGNERVSKFVFAQTVADVFGLNKNIVDPVPVELLDARVKRPRDVSLVSDKIKQEGFTIGGLKQDLNSMKTDESRFKGDYEINDNERLLPTL